MRPTILCLVNAAAFSRTYFEQLHPHLKRHGVDMAFALDSHLSDIMYADGNPLQHAWYFTDFCASEPRPSPDEMASARQRWGVLFSDFDRFLTIDIPVPLGDSAGLSYGEVPVMLDRFFARIFDTVRPAAVLYEQASNSFALAANEQAKKRGIPFFSLAPARIAGRVEISPTGALRDHVTVARIQAGEESSRNGPGARALAERYIRNVVDETPDYMRKGGDGEVYARTGLLAKYARKDKIMHILRGLKYMKQQPQDVALAYLHGSPLTISKSLFWRSLRRRLRVSRVLRLYRNGPGDAPYFVYPLHFHPEASTSVLAPDFVDELSVIKAIAFRLPVGVQLVVKEHPSAVALQPLDFYKQLDAMPNVVLVRPGANAKELARDALGVICVTSTLGFEGAALNKPVICLGDVLYGYFPNVRMIEHYGQLREAIDWALHYEPINPNLILDAMTAYVAFTDPGAFSFRESLGDDAALDNIAEILAGRLARPHTLMSSNQAEG